MTTEAEGLLAELRAAIGRLFPPSLPSSTCWPLAIYCRSSHARRPLASFTFSPSPTTCQPLPLPSWPRIPIPGQCLTVRSFIDATSAVPAGAGPYQSRKIVCLSSLLASALDLNPTCSYPWPAMLQLVTPTTLADVQPFHYRRNQPPAPTLHCLHHMTCCCCTTFFDVGP